MTAPRIALTREEAAAAVGLSDKTLDTAVKSGDLVAHYSGSKPLFRVADLEAWVASLPTEKRRSS